MHTQTSIDATPRERLIELNARHPTWRSIARPIMLIAVGLALLMLAGGAAAIGGGKAAHDLFQRLSNDITDAAEPPPLLP